MLGYLELLSGDSDACLRLLTPLHQQQALSEFGWLVWGRAMHHEHRLQEAKLAYQQALQQNPQSQPAMVQLATLALQRQEVDSADRYVQRVLVLEQDYAPALILSGYIALAEFDAAKAIEIWQQSIIPPARNAQVFFGLSQAYLRQGRFDEAVQAMSAAVLLDPQQSTYLSYWGKLLYQVRRVDKALTVLDSAIRLDPSDPTPWLYRAIALSDANRASKALEAYRHATTLNRGLAAYGSRAALDGDEAVRNVDFSRFYRELGLDRWAQQQALDSLQADYANPSAHVFGRGVANARQDSRNFTDQALLARLLQPVNANAFSRFRRQTNLFAIPATESEAAATVGNHGQAGLQLTASGAQLDRPLAWLVDFEHAQTDGWRDRNGESIDRLQVRGKWQSSPRNRWLIGVDVSDQAIEDDLFPRFEISRDVDELADFNSSRIELELGLHHRWSAAHEILAVLTHTQIEGDLRDEQTTEVSVNPIQNQQRQLTADFDKPSSTLQLQGISRLGSHQLVYGLLYADGTDQVQTANDFTLLDANQAVVDPLTTLDGQTDVDPGVSLTRLYLRDLWSISSNLQLDLGVVANDLNEADAFDGSEWSLHRTSGRAGLHWRFHRQHSLRLAGFEYLNAPVAAQLEVSSIAGVPFYRNVQPGALVRETDIVWDFNWDKGLLSTRAFRVKESLTESSLNSAAQPEVSIARSHRQGVAIDWNSLLGPYTGLAMGVAHFDVDLTSRREYSRDETALYLRLSYVDPGGIRLAVEHVLRDLNFDFVRGDDRINTTSLAMSYEFPGKHHVLSMRIDNLGDEQFDWVTDSPATVGIAPERLIRLRYQYFF